MAKGNGNPFLIYFIFMLSSFLAWPVGASEAFDSASQSFPAGINPETLLSGDYNSDGLRDVLVLSTDSAEIWVYLGQMGGGFCEPVISSIGVKVGEEGTVSVPLYALAHDFNKDGREDLVVGDFLGRVDLVQGMGKGRFMRKVSLMEPESEEELSNPVIGDFDGDGWSDVAVIREPEKGVPTVRLVFGDKLGGFTRGEWPIDFGSKPMYLHSEVLARDVNGDGRSDLIALSDHMKRFAVYQSGEGQFRKEEMLATNRSPYVFKTGQVTKGNDVLMVGHMKSNETQVFHFDESEKKLVDNDVYVPTGKSVSDAVMVDVNGDGQGDLVSLHFNKSEVRVFLQGGDGEFPEEASQVVAVANRPNALLVEDFSGDGKPDLVVLSFGSNSFQLIMNAGAI